MSRYLGGVRHIRRWKAKSAALSAVACAVALLTACSPGDDLMATDDLAGGDGATADGQPLIEDSLGSHTLTLSGPQRGYLDAIKSAGVRPSSDLLALSIGSYVCQARAAKRNDQAVWDFVLPLVRSDMRAAASAAHAPSSAEINGATADYIRIATAQLC